MKKTAVVYDKWLSTLGGGEVVACNFAKVLIDAGYETIFACGKKVDPKIILNKLGIDLSKAKFVEVWNDETKLKKITEDKDIFINASFMDYMCGAAQKNYYYTSFPTESYNSVKGMIMNNYVYPAIAKYIKPIEFITDPKSTICQNDRLSYQIGKEISLAFSFLKPGRHYKLKFFIFIESFSKTALESVKWEVNLANVNNKKVTIDHFHNVIKYEVDITPTNSTIYLDIENHNKVNKIFLIDPKIFSPLFFNKVTKLFYEKINSRLRAGVFTNVKERIKKYDTVFANSKFTALWIKKYWSIDAKVLYPPVEMLFQKYDVAKYTKENKICSVGRFFTLGHGKKQEIMIKAFIKIYNSGVKDWELHLAGGLGNEPTSIEFMKKLRKLAEGYPIYFHINCPREEVEKIYLTSKIYWHAAGFGENKKKHPIKFEHFGITPIEAMSAGCIPILFNGGGLSEIIKTLNYNTNPHLFSSINELVDNTIKIIKQKADIKFDNKFQLAEKKFSQKAFANKFKKNL